MKRLACLHADEQERIDRRIKVYVGNWSGTVATVSVVRKGVVVSRKLSAIDDDTLDEYRVDLTDIQPFWEVSELISQAIRPILLTALRESKNARTQSPALASLRELPATLGAAFSQLLGEAKRMSATPDQR